MGGGGWYCSRQAPLRHFFFLAILRPFCFASNLQLAFLELVEEGKNPRKNVRHACVNLCLLANDPATVPDALPCTPCYFM